MKRVNLKIVFLTVICSLVIATTLAQDFTNTFQSKLSVEQLINAPAKLMPYPQEVNWQEGVVVINKINVSGYDSLSISVKETLKIIFKEEIFNHNSTGFNLKFIVNDEIENEGYHLVISKQGIKVQYKNEAGQFYALQTLRQLTTIRNGKIHVQPCSIIDASKHTIRGFMLDVGRNFVSLDVLKEQLEIMAQYELNVFQWHLTDRPAWRIESKKYPELTAAKNHRPTRYPGKFYTYNEIRELIAFAKARHITVIPEIDMPGHRDSFVTAMGCKMESEKGMQVLEDVLNEFFKEIPVEMCPVIHLGSDEVHIKNPKEFMDKIIRVCQKNNRDIMAWNPELKIEQDVIRQTWQGKHQENKGYREIDSWNSYVNNGEPMTIVPNLLFKPIGDQSVNKIIGGVLCLWPHVKLVKENDFIAQNPLYPALLTYAWATWTADVTQTSDRFITMLPSKNTEAYHYFSAFESYLLHHKQRYFKNLPFQYIKQANNEWLLSAPLAKEASGLLEQKLISNKNIETFSWKKAVGNTTIIKDRFKQGGYYPKAEIGTTVYGISTINAEKDKKIKVWIGFETPLRANRAYTGIAQQGKWDSNGGTVWVNGKELSAPIWGNPGWKPSKTSGWGTKEDQEIPWGKEELYWTRKPVEVSLKKGENTVVFKVPSTTEYQNWMFTFAPLETVKEAPEQKKYSNHYYKRKALFEAAPDTKEEIIFLGNSITEGGDWKALFSNKNVVNRGISGDVTDGVLFRLDEVTASKPSKVFLLIGTNDMARSKSINYVVNGVEDIILQIQKDSEHTKIYIQSILPINPNVGKKFSGHKNNHQKIMDANKQLKALAKQYHLKYINLHKAMRNGKKYMKPKYTYDGLHLSDAGYVKWKKVIRKYVK